MITLASRERKPKINDTVKNKFYLLLIIFNLDF
jgi:hypothetical protein